MLDVCRLYAVSAPFELLLNFPYTLSKLKPAYGQASNPWFRKSRTHLERAGDGAHYAQDVYRDEGSVDSPSRVVSVFKRMTHRQIALQSDQYQVPNYKQK